MINKTTHFGFKKIPIKEKAKMVSEVFRSVASNYDLMNDAMSLGTHRIMKRMAIEHTSARPGQKILDLAGGTGDLTILLSKVVGSTGRVVLCDINNPMLSKGRDRLLDLGFSNNVSYIQADAEDLPFISNSFASITIGFGLRNFTDKAKALSECMRVLAPGGKLVLLEFSTPKNALISQLYNGYMSVWPHLGIIINDDRKSYQYLIESIKVHPSQERLSEMITGAGFQDVSYYNLLNGIAAIHVGIKKSNATP
ncbi:MAG: bifunctional demethylmenaquinone methyltransferase/2-methoxy-6-polyprenyl-1,4-benzoquinol methylase UbiE [Gammaproteobacteria bacterium TMED1]|nr:MAG: bifunctional demethylmenaquinone methyltransferase/2-methoxy-6-polyprenyl-1,4-benzoquinol methylase UbiE [Gammaproteobacteria bacterium TMED1]